MADEWTKHSAEAIIVHAAGRPPIAFARQPDGIWQERKAPDRSASLSELAGGDQLAYDDLIEALKVVLKPNALDDIRAGRAARLAADSEGNESGSDDAS